MSAHPTSADQFWLLTGEVPAGPFTVQQVHDELAAGRATWQTPACPVGGSTWLPLLKTPGIGPAAGGPASAAPSTAPPGEPLPSPASPPPTPTPAAPTEPPPAVRDQAAERFGLAIGVGILAAALAAVGAAAFGVYEWVRPLTPTEVCKKLEKAKTAAEARKYVTPRMYPVVDATYADKTPDDPNLDFAYTQEVDGPQPDTRLVGFRGAMFVQEAGRRVQMEGHLKLVKSDGWKVDDFMITGVEGASLPGPFSLVDEHRRSTGPAVAAGGKSGDWPLKKPDAPVVAYKPPETRWPDVLDPRKNRVLLFGLLLGGATVLGAVWRWLAGRLGSRPADNP